MNLPPDLTSKLNASIRRVRIIQLGRGLLATAGVALSALFTSMIIDAAIFIYSDTVRLIISCGGLLLTLVTAYISLYRPLADKIDPIRMARIIETRHPELQERISSALELIQFGGKDGEYASQQLLEILVTNAKSDISALSPQNEFTGRTIRPALYANVVLGIVLLLAFIIRPGDLCHLIKRSVAPTASLHNIHARHFIVQPGDITIVKGESVTFTLIAEGEEGSRAELYIERDDLPISIERLTRTPSGAGAAQELSAPLNEPGETRPPVPQTLNTTPSFDDIISGRKESDRSPVTGDRNKETSAEPRKEGTPSPATADTEPHLNSQLRALNTSSKSARFSMTMPNISSSFTYRVRIGNALTRRYTVTVIPAPAIETLTLSLTPPEYTQWPATQIVAGAEIPIRAPIGTTATLDMVFNRPMKSKVMIGDREAGHEKGYRTDNAKFETTKSVSWQISTNSASLWHIALKDSNGFSNAKNQVAYDAIPDYPPNIRLTYPSGNNYTLPTYGHLKTVYQLTDDYGIGKATLQIAPDNEKIPWTQECEVIDMTNGTYQVINDISLGEFMLGGARKVRIWIESEDNMPIELGGPNISKSRVIAVNLDNRENRSLADQVRVPERDAITNLLQSVAQRLENASKKLSDAQAKAGDNSELQTPNRELAAALEEVAEVLSEVEKETEEAAQKAKEGLFAAVSDDIKAVNKEAIQEAQDAVEEAILSDAAEQNDVVQETIEIMNKAAQEAREIIPEVEKTDKILETASNLEELSRQEASLAQKAKERQLTNQELTDWEAKQQEMAEKIRETAAAASAQELSEALNEQDGSRPPSASSGEDAAKNKNSEPLEPLAKPLDLSNKIGAMDEYVPPPQVSGIKPPPPQPSKPLPPSDDKDEAPAEPAQGDDGRNHSNSNSASDNSRAEAAPGDSIEDALASSIDSAKAAKEAPKDEVLLKKAREAEAAARESQKSVQEAERAKAAKRAIEQDREALKEIEKLAETAKKEAAAVKDDAMQVRFEQFKQEQPKKDPDVVKANELAKKAEALAALAEKAATDPTISREKLEVLADELKREAEELAKSDNPFLKQVASDISELLDKNSEILESSESNSESEDNSQFQDLNNTEPRDGGTLSSASVDAEQNSNPEKAQASDNSELRTPNSEPKDALASSLALANATRREQALEAMKQAEEAMVLATNLTQKLDQLVQERNSPKPQTAEPRDGGTLSSASVDAEQNSNLEKAQASENSEPASAPDALRDAAEELRDSASRAKSLAEAAEKLARKDGENQSASAAAKARQTAEQAQKTADAAQRALDAIGKLPEDAKPNQDVINKTNEAKRLANDTLNRAKQSEADKERISKTAQEHAAKAAELAQEAEALAAELSRRMNSELVNEDSELSSALAQKITEAKQEAQRAIEMAQDTKENLPTEAAKAANSAADKANQVKNAFAQAQNQAFPLQQKQAIAKNAENAKNDAAKQAEKAKDFAELSAMTPDKQVEKANNEKAESIEELKEITEKAQKLTRELAEIKPIAATNEVAKAAAQELTGKLNDLAKESEEIKSDLAGQSANLRPIIQNADRIAAQEKKDLKDSLLPGELTPTAKTANDARQLENSLRQAQNLADQLKRAMQTATHNPAAAEKALAAAAKNSEFEIRNSESEDSEQMSDRSPVAGDPNKEASAEPTQGKRPRSQLSSNSASDSSRAEAARVLANASREAQALASRLREADELADQARQALEQGNTEEAVALSEKAQEMLSEVTKAAQSSEQNRNKTAEKATAESKRYSGKSRSYGQNLMRDQNAGLSSIASNIVAAAESLDEANLTEAGQFAREALKASRELQAPSQEQLDAAKKANEVSQELKRMAMETAALAGLDPETMKIKKEKSETEKREKEKKDKKKRPAELIGPEGGESEDTDHSDDEEYEDGTALQMPEWLRKLGFPVSEWLKYKGNLESGLPDSALEKVDPEYRDLVREYFKILSSER